jgi:uncharacterized membrane protein YfcA
MQYLIGSIIALFIALTGVGAGTITVPVLVLFLGVPAAEAVAIGLIFSSAVKLILVPAQMVRGNVSWRVLGRMLLGGVPGVLLGAFFLKHLVSAGSQNLLNGILGTILITTAAWQIFFSFRPVTNQAERRDRSFMMPWLMFPVGAEVGFSSAGAGALGSAALLSLTNLSPAQVVGTDLAFGLLVSLIGSGAHIFGGGAVFSGLLIQLIAGGVVGAIGGTLLSTHIPRRPLRLALWFWLLFLGGQFLLNSYEVRHAQSKPHPTMNSRPESASTHWPSNAS